MSAAGKPLTRVDGRAKVTGSARYAVDFPAAGVAHAVIAGSRVARGRIARIDASRAERAPGVLLVMTHENAMKLPGASAKGTQRPAVGRVLQLLQDAEIFYAEQPIAVVVADTLERAQHAARLIEVDYDEMPHAVELEPETHNAIGLPDERGNPPDATRGDLEKGRAAAAVKVEATYTTPVEHHNPMELHATTAVWEGEDRLVVYDATQGIFPARDKLALTFGLPPEHVRVIAQFVGGGFGGKGAVWSHVALAAMAAKQVRLPVRLAVTRQQMFAFVGFRPRTIQKIELGATSAGALTILRHEGFSQTSRFDDFVEPFTAPAHVVYACPNVATNRGVVRLDTGTPQYMRAPGYATGTFALESAMDELAYALRMDPLELRLLNHADADPDTGRPWSSKSLKECYRRAAERFGWARRSREPGKTRDADGSLIGLGMATAAYPVRRSAASASARILADGTALVRAGTQDIGTGTGTSMTQVAADALGLAPERVRFELGDTALPRTPLSAASQTMASTGSAVHEACLAARSRLVQLAIADRASPLHGLAEKDVVVADGRLSSKHARSRGETIAALLGRSGLPHVEEQREAKPSAEDARFAMFSFGAQLCEVRVDPDLGTVRVARWVAAFAVGHAINPRMVHSQLRGGITFGIGMALMERSAMDARHGRFVTRDLAEYLVPVNADVPEIEVLHVDERDEHVNPIGAKGVGELGITGAAAAIANAVFHATGKRVRDLPITLDKLL